MSHPSIVFVAGSRQISRLPAEVSSRLDTMIEKGFQILVGDANGADKAVQRYLADKSYPNVLVHCMKDHCRNNVGHWPTREVAAPRGAKGFDYYSLKDRAMAETAEYGLMLWDGKSKGTVNNVVNLHAITSRSSSTSRPPESFARSRPSTISRVFSRKAIRRAWSES